MQKLCLSIYPASKTLNELLQVGFCTLYTFYAYPDKRRFRLSQILVLPPFQRHGIGAALLEGAYAMADKYDATDVTVRAVPILPRTYKALCCA